jgi:hypothetical protein
MQICCWRADERIVEHGSSIYYQFEGVLEAMIYGQAHKATHIYSGKEDAIFRWFIIQIQNPILQ